MTPDDQLVEYNKMSDYIIQNLRLVANDIINSEKIKPSTMTSNCKTDDDYTYNIVDVNKELDKIAGVFPPDFNYFDFFKKIYYAGSSLNILLPLFAFDNNITPTKCTTVKYNMCVIMNPSDEFKFINSADEYIGWKEKNSNPTHPIINVLLDQIAPSSNDPGDDREHFVEHNKLYHSKSAEILDEEKIITGSQLFGNQQKMIPFSVVSTKI